MYFPVVVPFPTFRYEGVDELFRGLELPIEPVYAGVASVGEAASYALTWEWGNVRQTQEGPKTVLGLNPDGARVWLSIQAPFGYIRINENKYWQIIQEELGDLRLTGTGKEEMRRILESAAKKITVRITEVIKETVPVDTGALRASITPVEPGDLMLEQDALTLEEERRLTDIETILDV